MAEEKADPAQTRRTPTQLLIGAMEHVEEMEEVMVIFRLTTDAEGNGGMGWTTERPSLSEKLAFIEEAKMAMFHNAYKERGGA
jgi:hypothetical protein